MEQDQRLTPLPKSLELRTTKGEYAPTYPAFYDDEVTEGRRSLQQYFNVVKKRLPIILAMTTLATAAAAFYMYRLPSEYTATTEMVIEPRKPRIQSKDSININFGADANYYNTQLELLRNTDLMKEVVLRLGLYKEPDLFGAQERGVLATVRSMFSSGKSVNDAGGSLPVVDEIPTDGEGLQTLDLSPEEKVRVDTYAAMLAGRLSVQQRERTNLVNVTVTTPKPQLSSQVADNVAEVFIDRDAKRETEGARKAYEDLSKSIEDLGRTITEQEADLIGYKRESGLPLQEKGEDLSASRLETLSQTWLKSMESRRQLEARYTAAVQSSREGKGMNIPDLYENKIFQDTMRINTERKGKLQDDIRNIEKQINELEEKKRAAAVKYTDEHPDIMAFNARIASLKETKENTEKEVTKIIETEQKRIEKDAVGGALVALKSQLDSARNQENQAKAAYDQEAVLANVQGQAQMELKRKKDALDTNRSLLNTYTQRQKEQELAIAS